MSDYKRSNTRYHSGYRSNNNFSTNNLNTNMREYTTTTEQNCNCNHRNHIDTLPPQWIEQFPPGMAYVPTQQFKNLYEIETGLQRGTIFSQIDFPFEVGFCARGCNCQ